MQEMYKFILDIISHGSWKNISPVPRPVKTNDLMKMTPFVFSSFMSNTIYITASTDYPYASWLGMLI